MTGTSPSDDGGDDVARTRWLWLMAAVAAGGLTRLPTRIPVSVDQPRAIGPRLFQVGHLTVEVTYAPLRLTIRDGAGDVVLGTVPDAPRRGRWRLPLPDPPLFGAPARDHPPLYAPFTFLLGADRVVQHRVGPWTGNIIAGIRAGVEHALTDVLEVEERDGGLELEVATTDPAGRRAIVSIGPDDAPDTVNVTVRITPNDLVAGVAAAFATPRDESFHGFGGRRDRTDQRGQRFTNWCEEFMQRPDAAEWVTRLVPGLDERWQWPSGAQSTYYVQPMFISSNGYGFWLANDERTRFRLAFDRDDAWHASAAAAHLEFVVAPGDAPTAVRNLTTITGRNPVPPEWALGPMISRAGEVVGESPEHYEANVEADLDAIERYDLPITGFSIEGWAMLAERGSLDRIIERMRSRGMRPVTYYKAFVGGSSHYEERGRLREALDQDLVARSPLGLPYLFGSPVGLGGIVALLDFSNPATRDWWRERIRAGLDAGAEGFMQDFGEQAMETMRFHDGSTGKQMHNRVPVLFHRTTREVLDEYVAEHPDREPWFFVRSGYTGRPGSAAYEPTNWGGDVTTDWSRASGIGSVIPDLLNRGLGGAYGYATDVGGYIDTFGGPDAELFTRWSQLAALIPCHRVHGSPFHGTHVPWSFDDETVERYRDSIELHSRAKPLILALWDEATRTGAPICRPLWWHHPDDDRARREEQQFLLGPDVLVAPVITPRATTREVYFPEGSWTDPATDETYAGPATAIVDAPLDRLPYFIRTDTDPFTV
ncbi:MAG: glycoside hydrolase family 31 protein [Nitriliruptorales bacterium]|nr:glycoside hydrolase family 31 protein [Nitriliruptorales bacterium]